MKTYKSDCKIFKHSHRSNKQTMISMKFTLSRAFKRKVGKIPGAISTVLKAVDLAILLLIKHFKWFSIASNKIQIKLLVT